MSRSVRIFVMISLLLNLLLAGVIAGHLLKGPEPASNKYAALETLPPERRDAIREKLEAFSRESKQGWAEVRAEKEKALQLLAAEPFDKKAYDARLKETKRRIDAQHAKRADMVKALAGTLSQPERAALAELLRQPPQWACSIRPHERQDKNMTEK